MTPEEKTAYMAAWYQKNKARLGPERKDYLAAYYQTNKERAAEAGKAYRVNNADKINAQRKAYRDSGRAKEVQDAWVNANREQVRKLKREEQKRNRDTRRDYDFRQKYGITLADYDEMFEAQGGMCAICFGPPKSGRRMAVDHDHDTGAIRGLLCNTCNLAIGHLKDDPMIVASAAIYLMEASHS